MSRHRGEAYFVHVCTLGAGTLPFLPEELRRQIYEATFPWVCDRCARCDAVVLLQSLQRTYFQARPFTRTGEGALCLDCRDRPRT
jgi:hypothetical protein